MKRREFLRRTAAVAAGIGAMPAAGCASLKRVEEPLFEETHVFTPGDGYPTFRIPSVVVTKQGTVLAFAEGRASQSDASQNDIVLRRSMDNGRTWEPLQVIAEDGPNVLVNPTAVVLDETGRVLLMYQRYPHGFHEREVMPGYSGDRICRAFITHSDDDGLTWSSPREITESVKRPTEVTSIASGPGVGVQLRRGAHAGRIVMPFNQGPWGAWKVYVAYSDDGGATWQYGETAPESTPGQGNEVQVVERSDGTILLNARGYNGTRHRRIAVSQDGGQTWSGLVDDTALIEPECQGTTLRYTDPLDGQRSRILFANPASQEHRVNGTVRLSYDEGRTWPVGRTVYAGPFAYSCLTALPDGTIGLLYERDGYERITFARFNLAWLTDGKDGL